MGFHVNAAQFDTWLTMRRKYEPKHIVRNVFALTERIPLE